MKFEGNYEDYDDFSEENRDRGRVLVNWTVCSVGNGKETIIKIVKRDTM